MTARSVSDEVHPVAWMSPDGKVSTTRGVVFCIPLYTHPAVECPDHRAPDGWINLTKGTVHFYKRKDQRMIASEKGDRVMEFFDASLKGEV